MRLRSKLIVGIISFIILAIAFLTMCYMMYKKNGRLSQAHTIKAERLLKSHMQSEAIVELEKALELDPANDDAESRLYRLYLSDKQYEKSIIMLQRQLKEGRPDEFLDYLRKNKLARMFIETNKIDDAKKIYESMLPKYSQGSGIYLGLAVCYEKEGNLSKALEYHVKAISIMKNNPKFVPQYKLKQELQHLVDLYKKAGQEESANKTLTEIANIK